MKNVLSLTECPTDAGYWGRQVNEFMQSAAEVHPHHEFELLLLYLAEFAGMCDKIRNTAYSTCIQEFAELANDAFLGKQRIIDRLKELYDKRG
jgi:hypothetical protein